MLYQNTKYKKLNKKGLTPLLMLGLFVLAIVGVVSIVNWAKTPTPPLSAVGGQTLSVTSPTGVGQTLVLQPSCAKEDVTVSLSGVDAFNPGTATGGSHLYRQISASSGKAGAVTKVQNTGTFTAAPGNTLEILWFNTSVGSDNGNFYAKKESVVVPCEDPLELKGELYDNATVTVRVFNEEGNLISSPENETLGAGDVVTLKSEQQGSFKDAIPYGGVCVAEANTSNYDDIVLDFGGKKTTTPGFYTNANANSKTWAYTIAAITGTQTIPGTITIDVDDTNNPGDADSDITLNCYSLSPYHDSDTDEFVDPAVENEDETQVGQRWTFTLSVD